jgi:uncharacterized membrane protein YphA (DoxX/SURF4 family)
MKYLTLIVRALLGLLFLVMGLNGFLNFIPPPPEGVPAGAMEFSMAMMKTGYFLQFVKGTEVVVGALLLTNLFVPLALVVLAPVLINIIAFHVFLAPSGVPMGLVIAAMWFYLAWTYRSAYRPMLGARVKPA